MMEELHTEDGLLQNELRVVHVRAPVLPNAIVVHVPHMYDMSVLIGGGGERAR